MGNSWFEFRQFRIEQPGGVFRVGTDGVLLGAWAGASIRSPMRLLDVGTGTGLIAIMLAQRFPDARITAIEPDPESVSVAEINAAASPWSDRIEIINESLSAFTAGKPGVYDLIVSNPPYFSESLKNPDPRKASFRHAGTLTPDGLFKASEELLSPGGALCLIMPWAEGNVAVAAAAASGLYCNRMTRIRPLSASPFNRLLLEFVRTKTGCSVNILTTGHPSHGGYTRDYTELTRDFYPGL